MLPLAGEKAEKKDDEAVIESPGGDDTRDDGLVRHGAFSVGNGCAPVKASKRWMAMRSVLTKGTFGRNVQFSMTRAATTSILSVVAARKRLR